MLAQAAPMFDRTRVHRSSAAHAAYQRLSLKKDHESSILFLVAIRL
jgi:hypothetical protein